jgi:dienelactone hydrolase
LIPSYVHTDFIIEQDVVIGEGEWQLAGKITFPKLTKTESKLKGIILIHGSGPNDMDETVGANKPFKNIAQGLASFSETTLVLRFHKRTFQHKQKLTQDWSQKSTIKEEVLEDVVAAIKFLKTLPIVDSKQIFLLGHSLGASIPHRVLEYIKENSPELSVRGYIMLAGAARPLYELMEEQFQYISSIDPESAPKEVIQPIMDDVEKLKKAINDSAHKENEVFVGVGLKYWRDYGNTTDVEMKAEKYLTTLPLLILQGGRDYQVTLKDFNIWKNIFKGDPKVTFKVYPSLNHLFISGEGASKPAEYFIPGCVDSEVLKDIVDWIFKL